MRHSIYDERLALILEEARLAKGIDQRALAKTINRPQSFVSHYENCERHLRFGEIITICRVLGLDPVEVVRDTLDALQ